jgi:hypothetical protein
MVAPVIGADPRPKHVIAAGRDTLFPPASLREATAGWVGVGFEVVDAADHFFVGQEADVGRRCAAVICTGSAHATDPDPTPRSLASSACSR